MFLRFKEKCNDKKTGEIYSQGTIKEFPDERAAEILSVQDGKYAEQIMVEVTSTDEPTRIEDDKRTALEKLSKAELEDIVKKMGLKVNGKKAEIVEQILKADAGEADAGTNGQ